MCWSRTPSRIDFPRAVAALAKGVLTIGAIDELGHRSHPEARSGQRGPSAQNERRRNLLLAMVEDVRVVIIELADRLERLRGPTQSAHLADSTRVAHPDPENLALTARATLDVYAPLASRLGIWQLKWELEALALRALEPDTYRDIAQQLESRRAEREQYIERVKNDLDACLEAEGISSQTTRVERNLSRRAKLIDGIVRKMRKKQVGFDQIFDGYALRVMLADVTACYAALGLVHARWTPIPAEFDDHIANPKPNGYRSLHTAVIGPSGKTIEVQLRTADMHQQAEFGVAAHWRYKGR